MVKHNTIRLLLLVATLLAANSAAAEWVEVGGNENTTVYADLATIRKAGNKAEMWGLVDLKNAETRTSKPYLSTKLQIEFDCQKEQYRFLALSSHSENMGKGETVYTDNAVADWKTIQPSSAVKTLWKTACRKWQEL